MIKKLINLLLISAVLGAGSCNSSNETSDNPSTDSVSKKQLDFNSEQIGEVIQNFSSPVEMATLIKGAGIPFSKELLCPTDNADSYNTNFKRALGLGMLGVDLGYLNIYNKTSPVVNYVTIIKKLSEEMKVGQFFDFVTLKRLATNNSIDSLTFMSTSSFNQMDTYLRENDKGNLSSLMVAGVWVEGLYLATQVVKGKPNKDISERIGEQKIILNDILLLLGHYKEDASFAALIKDFEQMKEMFKEVNITYKNGEPKSESKDGTLVVIQNETSNVEITNDQLSKITNKTEQIRNKLISLQ